MSNLHTFIQEIENRKKNEISSLDKTLEDKKSEIQETRNTTIEKLEQQYGIEAKLKANREASRIVEAARSKAKRIVFDAINENMNSTFSSIRQELTNFTQKDEYKKTLEKMIKYAKKELGKDITVSCRNDDNKVFEEMKIQIDSNINTLGGIIATNKEGNKELDLTFEEILRTREDDIKSFLLERMIK